MAIAARIDLADLGHNILKLIERVRGGEEVAVIEGGSIVARIVPPSDPRADARATLEALRARAHVGDVESPLGEAWEAADDHP
jgi:antitoxin (DNA-binding transcriptional repressor) of toxin-antitoxin stability system